MTGSGRRVALGIADQALSSATNFAMLIVAAGVVGRATFGALGIAFAVYATAIGIARACASEPLAVRFSAVAPESRKDASAAALGVAWLVGLCGAVISVAVGLALGGVVGGPLVALAVVLPGLLVQDTWRFVFMAAGRPRAACANDAAWLTIQAVGLLLLATVGELSATSVILAWGIGGSAAAALALLQSDVRLQPRSAKAWLRAQRDLWPRFGGEFLALAGSWQLALVGLAVVAGLDTVGSLRAAQILVGPLNVAFLAVPLVFVPESRRLWRSGASTPVRHGAMIGGLLVGFAIAWGGVVALVPNGVGRDLLGASWRSASDLLPAVVLVMCGVGLTLGALCVLRVLEAARHSLAARTVTASFVVLAMIIGGATAGAPGAAWGWSIAALAGAAVWWHRARRAWHEGRASALAASMVAAS